MSTSVSPHVKLSVGTYRAPLLALCVLAGTFVLGLNPHSHGPACIFRLTTGIPCPGCGMTRSLSSIWRGDFLLSLRFHPLGLPLFGICVCCILFFVSDRFCPRLQPYTARMRTLFMHTATLSSIAVLMVVLWTVRLLLDRTGHHFFMW